MTPDKSRLRMMGTCHYVHLCVLLKVRRQRDSACAGRAHMPDLFHNKSTAQISELQRQGIFPG